ncbi:MAG: hypothetical protein EXR79_05465 [Myxococcales bacterium]|nr:hypothetical protein [Myxococcales bacterium]
MLATHRPVAVISAVATALSLLLAAPVTFAAVPQTLAVQGTVLAVGGGAAPDGLYDMVFRLHDAEFNGKELWIEGAAPVGIKNGIFSHTIGMKTPLDGKVFTSATSVWIGVTIQGEAELPRRQLHAVPFALHAAVAGALDCSGCLTLAHLDANVLKAYAKTTELAKVAVTGKYEDLTGGPDLTGYVKAGELADVALDGKFKSLTGVPVLAHVGEACGAGLVVRGIKADGSYDCVQGFDLSALPSDGLDEISGGLLFNQFNDLTGSGTMPLKIKDNNPDGVSDAIDVPDLGLAQGITVNIELTNSDVSKLSVLLFDPQGKKYVLSDNNLTGKGIKASWPPTTLLEGDLATWNGKNPKGTWKLTVIDVGFLDNTTDGVVVAWSIGVKTLSTKKVGLGGGLQWYVAAVHPVACNAYQLGFTYLNSKDKSLYVCNGKDWFGISLVSVGTADNPGLSCADILKKQSGAKDGAYWIAGPAGAASLTWCDMTLDGGGWTLVMRMANNGTLGWSSAYWTDDQLLNEAGPNKVEQDLNSNAKFGAYMTVAGDEIRGCKGIAGAQCVKLAMGGKKSAYQVFQENYKSGGISKATAVSWWGDDAGQPHCNGTGLNNHTSKGGPGTYSGARFGVVGNNENDCATTDSGWGWGVYGTSGNTNCGCGLAAWSVASNCTHGTLWVR